MTVYGYARVSTQEQDTRGQVAALSVVCDVVVVVETASGGKADRPKLQALLERGAPSSVSSARSGSPSRSRLHRLYQPIRGIL